MLSLARRRILEEADRAVRVPIGHICALPLLWGLLTIASARPFDGDELHWATHQAFDA